MHCANFAYLVSNSQLEEQIKGIQQRKIIYMLCTLKS